MELSQQELSKVGVKIRRVDDGRCQLVCLFEKLLDRLLRGFPQRAYELELVTACEECCYGSGVQLAPIPASSQVQLPEPFLDWRDLRQVGIDALDASRSLASPILREFSSALRSVFCPWRPLLSRSRPCHWPSVPW